MIVGLLIITPEPTPGGGSLISGAGLRRVRFAVSGATSMSLQPAIPAIRS